MKILRPGKRLGNNARSNQFPALRDQLAVGLIAKEYLGQRRYHCRVDQPQQHGGDQGKKDRRRKVLFHIFFYALCQSQGTHYHINGFDTDERHNHSAQPVNQQVTAQQRLCVHGTIFHPS